MQDAINLCVNYILRFLFNLKIIFFNHSSINISQNR